MCGQEVQMKSGMRTRRATPDASAAFRPLAFPMEWIICAGPRWAKAEDGWISYRQAISTRMLYVIGGGGSAFFLLYLS